MSIYKRIQVYYVGIMEVFALLFLMALSAHQRQWSAAALLAVFSVIEGTLPALAGRSSRAWRYTRNKDKLYLHLFYAAGIDIKRESTGQTEIVIPAA